MNSTTNKTEAEIVAAYRAANPLSRAVRMFKFVRNGGACKQMGCIVCGEAGPSWCARYAKTQRALAWEAAHKAQHGITK